MALIIFDYGGVLANDLVVSWSVISNIVASYGKIPDTLHEFRNNFKLPYQDYLVDKGFEKANIPSLDIPSQFVKGYLDKMDAINAFPDTIPSVRRLCKKHVLVVLSSTPRLLVIKFLESKGIVDCFDRIYGHEDIGKEKPKPSPVLKILKETGFDKKRTMLAGDMKEDIQSSKKAGIISIAVAKNESYHTRDSLLKARPHHMISNLTELETIVDKYDHS